MTFYTSGIMQGW